jgi:hypothetical protein
MQSLKRVQRALGYGSPSPERDASGRIIRRRAASPPQPTEEELQLQYNRMLEESRRFQAQQNLVQEESLRIQALQIIHNREVDMIIDNLNQYLFSFFGGEMLINVDEDLTIRFIIGKILTSNNVRLSVVQKLRRNKVLLTAVANFIITKATISVSSFIDKLHILLPFIKRGLKATGRFLFQAGVVTGRAAYNVMSSAASITADSIRAYINTPPAPQIVGRAASPQQEMQQSIRNMASAAYESIATGLPEFYNALSSVLRHVYELLSPCVSSTAIRVVSLARRGFTAVCAYLTPQQAVERAVSEVVNRATPPQQEEEESICAICMEGEQENPEPLGYVAVHNPPLDNRATGYIDTGHPNRFHQSCLQGCQNKCPICRAVGPVWGMQRRERQGGGGLKKYRSRSRSKSKSKPKTRRLRKYRCKPRKSYKSKKSRCSSRRK